jgi:hypothetical protein
MGATRSNHLFGVLLLPHLLHLLFCGGQVGFTLRQSNTDFLSDKCDVLYHSDSGKCVHLCGASLGDQRHKQHV